MAKIKSLEELKKIREQAKGKLDLRIKGDNIEKMIQVKVAMATCGIASGARDVMDYFIELINKEELKNVVVTQTGCMGYCYAEPTVEITLPNQEPVIYGNVDKKKVEELVEKTIKNGQLVDGIIPVIHKTIED